MRGPEKSNFLLLHDQDLAAMIKLKAEPIFAIEVVMAGIPLADSLGRSSIELIQKGRT